MKRVITSVMLLALLACRREPAGPVVTTSAPPAAASSRGGEQPQGSPPGTVTPPGVMLPGSELAAGAQLPVKEFKALSGGELDLDDLRGKAVMVNIWATWCVPCREEMPDLNRLVDSLKGKPFAMVGINVDEADNLSKVKEFVTDLDIDYPIGLDPESALLSALNTPVLPTTILINREGKATWLRMGPIRHDDPKVVAAIEAAMR